MKLSEFFLPTLKEDPADATIISHKLMLRAGMIRQLTAGVYSYLPFGLKVFSKIKKIIREEMNAIGGIEFFLPSLTPNELWQQSGRLDEFGDDIFRIKNRELVLAPTHEEVFTSLAKQNLVSYKDFPKIWYQIQTKFRNEARPRGGVIRVRQFEMKDAYSLDADWQGLDKSYKLHDKAYNNIFTRCGLKYFAVSAHSGAMGGSESKEFMAISDAGEDTVVYSENGNYYSNIDVAQSFKEIVPRQNSNLPAEKFYTPNIKTIEELVDFVGTEDKKRLAKSRIYINTTKVANGKNEDRYILVLLCGDDEVNELKLQDYLGGTIRAGQHEELMEITGADAGSIGPIGLKNKSVRIISDLLLQDADELISGANENDYHYKHIDFKRDVPNIEYTDIRVVKEGEWSIDKTSKLKITKAIEVGHIFKLGTKYSEALNAKYLDKNGKEHVIVMGSYGIGVPRIAAAHIEQNHDKDGIIWNGEIAPYQLILICINVNNEKVKSEAEVVYKELSEKYEVLYDDRTDQTPGVKFKDADLIGIPIHIIISEKNLKNNEIEIKIRKTGERIKVEKNNLLNVLTNLIKNH